MKQTAVEWLIQEINKINVSTEARIFINKLKEQAKAMEKEQKIEFAEKYANSDAFYCSGEFDIEKGAEQYYNETFKSEKDFSCVQFILHNKTSSATKCICGREKWQHTNL